MNELEIKQIRENLGLTQKELAKLLGVHERTVQNWESGTEIPGTKYKMLCEIARKGEVKAHKVYGGGDYQINEHGDNIKGETVTVNGSKSETDKLIDALAQQQSIAIKSQEQIDRLITLIEKLTDKQSE